ncbi:nicotinate-nucleotide--dimethylbenzimidazole phosphoribosyltransferase [Desulfogranum marinum]|uniref:nicotinate-nucleotide--dimethylbenzimidazole phosphoribosyltransferase n=1 Tax=Desulfogranum marinum TaxID=453220 RepID=UPI00196481A8|nr:nicotinate-nucleotide--dimethylbenzimidazole phosphoribosyltransferase [Desulfogranum marinum]MBM9513510.1 nicotinate-nucleotide--dimethylbenzimidazole phosphoribosyltransferase [Desulfogranum marinum]
MQEKEKIGYLESTCRNIYPQDSSYRDKAKARLDQLTMPHWALGDLMDLAVDLAGMTRSMTPPVARKKMVVMAGDHGVTAEGVSGYPAEVTTQMVHNIMNKGAGINALANKAGAEVLVVDMGAMDTFEGIKNAPGFLSKKIAQGTQNIMVGPAMTKTQAVMAVEAGIEIASALAVDVDVFGTGEMGIGNTTPSSAIAAVVTGKTVEEVTGKGTGIDDEQLTHKVGVIKQAIAVNKPDAKDGIDVLTKLGGYEIGGIAGLILGAAALKKPVVVDGFISTAGALIAYLIEPFVRDYIICAHKSVEPGHSFMQQKMHLRPLFDLNLRLGEGTGAAFAMHALEAATAILTDVSTFAEAGVSQKE